MKAQAEEGQMLMGARGMLDRVVYCSRTTRTSFSAIPTELSPRYILLVEALVNKKKILSMRAQVSSLMFSYRLQKLDCQRCHLHFVECSRKQIEPCNSTTKEVLFEWSLHRISTTNSKVRSALQNSTILLSEKFYWNNDTVTKSTHSGLKVYLQNRHLTGSRKIGLPYSFWVKRQE